MVVGPAERLRCPPPEIIRAPNTPVPVGPVFGFTDELNPATRVTAEAAMDLPSPPFFFGPSVHPLLQKSRKKMVL